MEITLKGEYETADRTVMVSFSDKGLDVDNWVRIAIGEGEGVHIPLDQLMSAVIAFESKYSRRLANESQN